MDTYEKNRMQFTEYLQVERNASAYTIEYYMKDLDEFYLFLKRENIQSLFNIDFRLVRLFLTELYSRQLSKGTISRKLSSLRSFYKFLEREYEDVQNPFIHISLPKSEELLPNFFYEEEMEQLFKVSDITTPLGQRNQAIIELLYATGMRVSECQDINIEDIDFSIQSILVRGKGRKERYVLFGTHANEALERYMNDGREKLLSHSSERKCLFLNAKGLPLTERGFRFILNDLVKKASLTIDIHPHKLRHTFATHMLDNGADLRTVQELLGHENLSSTQVYTHVTKDRLKNVYMNAHPRARTNKR
ncbi:MAG TPA: tyrosine recombinase XerC [Bacillota bacterium]|nr:tyrosine recombinase XerC [Bacillota bacterium]